MVFTSILDLQENLNKGQPRAAFYQDLNLDRVIRRICQEWEEDVSSFYYYLPSTRECEEYRREVFADVRQTEVYESLRAFVERMKKWQEAAGQKNKVHSQLQNAVCHISEVKHYCEAFLTLERELSALALKSRGMTGFLDYLRKVLEGEEFHRLYETAVSLRTEFDKIRLVLDYRDGRISVVQGEVEGAYERFLRQSFPDNPRSLKSPFDVSPDLSDIEAEILKILRKRQPELFKRAEDFGREYRDYAEAALLRFAAEIRYYLSFCCFEKKMKENGFCFAAPDASEERNMYATGLYDLALACVNMGEHRTVVANDMEYCAGERFFVLTGPNQGGKTTFARSLGQLVYFTKMGLDVPATAANVHHFSGLLTHFSVEESVETGRGKLKEELVRLEPMMSASGRNAFVVINELFTTAANYDACIMGKRVLEHFSSQQCSGIYVTHLRELAEGGEGIVSLRAMLDESGRQSFRIERSGAVESASAINQVNKYRLTYEQLKERLKRRECNEGVSAL